MELTRRDLIERAAAYGLSIGLAGALAGCGGGGGRAKQLPRATRAGALPEDGRPRVAGISLPRGRRWAPDTYAPHADVGWCTDAGVDGGFELARRLASAFPQTGLWPCLWDDALEGPAYYFGGPTAPERAIDPRKAQPALAARWSRPPPRPHSVSPFGRHFPGLAKPTGRTRPGFDRFGALEQSQRLEASWRPSALRPRLLLISCRYPADAIALTGFTCGTGYGGIQDQALVSSVLRSWEQRFGTVLVSLAPGETALAVGAPPSDVDHALHIAAEHYALAPRDDAGAPGALARLARGLLEPPNPHDLASSRDLWILTWGD
jgi:Domain of unknown function (DUF4253)